MGRYFTHYWDNGTWAEEQARGDEGQTLGRFYGNQFMRRRLQGGDVIYALTVLQSDLFVLCRVEVEQVEARGDPEGRWGETVVVRPGTSTRRHFANMVPRDVTHHLSFVTAEGVTALHAADSGKLDPMTFRQMRQLSAESVALLDEVLNEYESEVEQVAHDVATFDEEADLSEDGLPGIEGARARVLVNRYERDPSVRAAAKRIHGTRCEVCGFSFEEFYGDRGKGFIEVHHLRPLSTHGQAVEVDPRADVAVLCANCHRMVHRDSLITPQALLGILRELRERNGR